MSDTKQICKLGALSLFMRQFTGKYELMQHLTRAAFEIVFPANPLKSPILNPNVIPVDQGMIMNSIFQQIKSRIGEWYVRLYPHHDVEEKSDTPSRKRLINRIKWIWWKFWEDDPYSNGIIDKVWEIIGRSISFLVRPLINLAKTIGNLNINNKAYI